MEVLRGLLSIMKIRIIYPTSPIIIIIIRFQGRSLPLRFAYFRKTCNTFVSVIRKPIRKSQHGNTRLVLSISKTSFLN